MRLRALAKINLGLDVLRKREDGYHELRMIMQTINMYDQLDIEISKTPGIKITTNLPFIPVNESNLVYKAAKLLMDEFQVEQGITVDLQNNLNKIADCMGNVLETVTIPHYPVIQKIKDHMKEHGALNAMMSGSGPTVFGLFDDKATAENACEALRESRLARTVFLTTVFNNGGRRK